jgi:hypothetical protein
MIVIAVGNDEYAHPITLTPDGEKKVVKWLGKKKHKKIWALRNKDDGTTEFFMDPMQAFLCGNRSGDYMTEADVYIEDNPKPIEKVNEAPITG